MTIKEIYLLVFLPTFKNVFVCIIIPYTTILNNRGFLKTLANLSTSNICSNINIDNI